MSLSSGCTSMRVHFFDDTKVVGWLNKLQYEWAYDFTINDPKHQIMPSCMASKDKVTEKTMQI